MNRQNVKDTILSIKEKIRQIESDGIHLSEIDTRQGLINPLFKALGWDFSDFKSVRSEYKRPGYNESADYAFFASDKEDRPSLILEAKVIGKNLNDKKIEKQLCTYLGEMGVKWGVISDGNKYIMYNSKGGISFEEKKFLTMQIKTVDTEDGVSLDELVDKFEALLSRSSLSSDDIQKTYEDHITNNQIEDALNSLLSEPFDTLASAIRKEFKEERVQTSDLRIQTKTIVSYLKALSDEDGKIPLDLESQEIMSQDSILQSVASSEVDKKTEKKVFSPKFKKRLTLFDLLEKDLLHEGDNLKSEHKGEVHWGRVTGNGEIEVEGRLYKSPSSAGREVSKKGSCPGWNFWKYKNKDGKWQQIDFLRQKYRNEYGLAVSSVSKRRARRALSDTIVVPARKEGFDKVFMGENAWYAIRLKESLIGQIKYIASYQTSPISAVTHVAKVKEIKPYEGTEKFIVLFEGEPQKLERSLEAEDSKNSPQGLFYTTYEKLMSSKNIEDLLEVGLEDKKVA